MLHWSDCYYVWSSVLLLSLLPCLLSSSLMMFVAQRHTFIYHCLPLSEYIPECLIQSSLFDVFNPTSSWSYSVSCVIYAAVENNIVSLALIHSVFTACCFCWGVRSWTYIENGRLPHEVQKTIDELIGSTTVVENVLPCFYVIMLYHLLFIPCWCPGVVGGTRSNTTWPLQRCPCWITSTSSGAASALIRRVQLKQTYAMYLPCRLNVVSACFAAYKKLRRRVKAA